MHLYVLSFLLMNVSPSSTSLSATEQGNSVTALSQHSIHNHLKKRLHHYGYRNKIYTCNIPAHSSLAISYQNECLKDQLASEKP